MLVAEAYARVVCNGASVVHLADIGPEYGAETHVAGLPSGVESATREVVGTQHLAGFAYGHNLTVCGGVVVL